MPVNENGNPRPDGISVSVPIRRLFGIGGTYYWNPGSPTAPSVTLTGSLGTGGGGVHTVFLRPGMTSQDTLGYGATANIAPTIVPSATVNATIPDNDGIPLPWKPKVSSVEAGISRPGFAGTYTITPQQIADLVFSPAIGPDDELSPFVRRLQSSVGTVGPDNSQPPIRFLSSRYGNPLGTGMSGWLSSVDGSDPQSAAQPAPSPEPLAGVLGLPGFMAGAGLVDPSNPDQAPAGGLLGLMQDYLRNNPGAVH